MTHTAKTQTTLDAPDTDPTPHPRHEQPTVHRQPPALTADDATAHGLIVRGYSRRGAAHRLVGEPRQDAFGYRLEPHLSVLVVADGVGSIASSHHGAQAAVDATLALLDDPSLTLDNPTELVTWICERMRQTSHDLGLTPEDLACTWVAVFIHPADPITGNRRTDIFTIGDAEALTIDNGTWTSLTSDLDHAATNVIDHCLPTDPGIPRSTAHDLTTTGPLVLASDGFTDALRADRTGTPYTNPSHAGRIGSDLAQRWSNPRSLHQYATDLGFDIHHDDFTALTAWVRPINGVTGILI